MAHLTPKWIGALESDIEGKVPYKVLLWSIALFSGLGDAFSKPLSCMRVHTGSELVMHDMEPTVYSIYLPEIL